MIKKDTMLGCAVITCMSILLGTSALHGCEAAAGTRKDVALLLAQSCVGEAGFGAHRTGECAAIWHVYLKRATLSGKSLIDTARRYSATIKPRKCHPRPWVLKLNRAGDCPAELSTKVEWSFKRRHWLATLLQADEFLKGSIRDPLPKAEHYGGAMDIGNLSKTIWVKLRPAGFVNIYYERRSR